MPTIPSRSRGPRSWLQEMRSLLARLTSRGARDRRRTRTAPGTKTGPGGTTHLPTEGSPGQFGPEATGDVDVTAVGPVMMVYRPRRDDAPDPGEVVWSWVPFEEHDGRGKDRPVLLVAAESSEVFLGVQLTSKDHPQNLPVGRGDWDVEHRSSFARLDRVLRVHRSGMRRIGAEVSREAFERVAAELIDRHGWRTTTG